MKYFILFLFLTTVKSSDDVNITGSANPYNESKIQSYLEQFGYLESNRSLLTETSLTSGSHTNEALIRFQEFYNLPADGTLNQKTLAFISKLKCGVKDNSTAYRSHYQKWNKTNLKWYLRLATNEMKELSQKAFERCQKGKCSKSLEGTGNILAHAFFPSDDKCRGIYFDKSENWYFGELSVMIKLIFILFYYTKSDTR